jgi:isopropylmalate/homocitrate/citramalate synthase
MIRAEGLIHSWNRGDDACLRSVKIEEDIRDALQSVHATRPSTEERVALLELSDRVGVQFGFLGFPAASQAEEDQCTALAAHAAAHRLAILPVFMARAVEADIPSVCRVRDKAAAEVAADIFIAISDIRFTVEKWTLSRALEDLHRTAVLARSEGLQIRISLEDSSRASPENLQRALTLAADLGATAITLCDTVGASTPSGAWQLAAFGRNIVSTRQSTIDIGWHGHNDKGLALANAIAAAAGGASIISGTFLGFGERTGNIPLEQVIYLLAEAGHDAYDLKTLPSLCELFCAAARVPMPINAPLVGAHAFSTSTGTHVAAIDKARALGGSFEDLVYSGVRAADLGRVQSILIGPNSGRRAVAALLGELGIPSSTENVTRLLAYCKAHDRSLCSAEAVRAVLGMSLQEAGS